MTASLLTPACLNGGLQALAFMHAGCGLCSHHHWRELHRHRGKTCLGHSSCGDRKLETKLGGLQEINARRSQSSRVSLLEHLGSLALCSRQSGCPVPEPWCLWFREMLQETKKLNLNVSGCNSGMADHQLFREQAGGCKGTEARQASAFHALARECFLLTWYSSMKA